MGLAAGVVVERREMTPYNKSPYLTYSAGPYHQHWQIYVLYVEDARV